MILPRQGEVAAKPSEGADGNQRRFGRLADASRASPSVSPSRDCHLPLAGEDLLRTDRARTPSRPGPTMTKTSLVTSR